MSRSECRSRPTYTPRDCRGGGRGWPPPSPPARPPPPSPAPGSGSVNRDCVSNVIFGKGGTERVFLFVFTVY